MAVPPPDTPTRAPDMRTTGTPARPADAAPEEGTKGRTSYVFNKWTAAGAVALLYLVGQHEWETKPHEESQARRQHEIQQTNKNFQKYVKEGTTAKDLQDLGQAGVHMNAAAQFVDTNLWSMATQPNGLRAPTLASRQLELLARELGKDRAYQEFYNMSHHTAPERLYRIETSIAAAEALVKKLSENPDYKDTIKESRFEAAAKMIEQLPGARCHYQIGIGSKTVQFVTPGAGARGATPAC